MRVLGYLASLPSINPFVTGEMIREATGLEVDDINDAIELLRNRGFAFAHIVADPQYRFTQIKITPEGKLFWEQEKFKIEETADEF